MIKDGKVYGFTNENLSILPSIYEFNQKRVLTVLGSGDQYFSSKLFGAKTVEVFDNNPLTWPYFVLKFMGIRNFTYEEFYDFFATKKCDDQRAYEKLRKYLPGYVKMYFDYLSARNILFSKNFFSVKTFGKTPEYGDGSIIPYFSLESYKKLQRILNKVDLPKFYEVDLKDFKSDDKYDLMLLSNVFQYLPFGVSTYKEFLTKFNCPTIEALYIWPLQSLQGEVEKFLAEGFEIDYVTSAIINKSEPDNILTLRR